MRPNSSANPVAEMSDAGFTFENPDPLELASLDAEMFEQTAPFAEQDRYKVDLDLV